MLPYKALDILEPSLREKGGGSVVDRQAIGSNMGLPATFGPNEAPKLKPPDSESGRVIL